MGIFKEDLLNLGNLIDTEVEVKLGGREFGEVYPGLGFVFENGLLRIRGSRKVLFFRRPFELRAREDPGNVYTVKDHETKDFGIRLLIVSREGIDEVLKRDGFRLEGEHLCVSLFPVFRRTDIYRDIPDTFRDRIKITRYRIRDGYLSVFLTVTK
ncbi:MAG: hypothetical protein Q9N26_08650 [Aquificota bacterium]|nr:hypothetical protein [Aquificota bacterium]